MEDAIKNFAAQFEWEPKVENSDKWKPYDKFIVAGMGGSHLAAGLLEIIKPGLDVVVHRDYGLPDLSKKELTGRLLIASSYSGNTEEVIDAFDEAVKKGLNLAAISVGGKLIERAKKAHIPYVVIPQTGIQPRSALGFSLRAMLKLMGLEELLKESSKLAQELKPQELRQEGSRLAEKLKDQVPVIYASRRNFSLAYNWKIKMNETGKIPAFYNVFPELNHNEMTGFDVTESSRHLSKIFHFLFLKNENDHPKIQKRLEITAELYRQRGLVVEVMELTGKSVMEKVFRSLVIADWTAVRLAEIYGLEAEQVPMVEEFKKLIT